jgi:hypothetical protein
LSVALLLGWKGGIEVQVERLHVRMCFCTSDTTARKTGDRRSGTQFKGTLHGYIKTILEAYNRFATYGGYWSIIVVKVHDVDIEIDNALSVTASSVSANIAMSSTESGATLGGRLQSLRVQCVDADRIQPSSAAPLLHLSNVEGTTNLCLNPLQGTTVDMEVGECILGASMHNTDILTAVLVRAAEVFRLAQNSNSFDALTERLAAIDALRASMERLAAETGRNVQDLADEWDQIGEEEYHLALEGPRQQFFHGPAGTKHPANVSVKLLRVGVAVSSGHASYEDQVLCLCDVELAVTQRLESLESDGPSVVRSVVAAVGSVHTKCGSALDLAGADCLGGMQSASPQLDTGTSEGHKCCAFAYEVLYAAARSTEEGGAAYQGRVSGSLQPLDLTVSAGAVSVLLTMAAECGTALACLRREPTERLLNPNRQTRTGAPRVVVELDSADISAPYVRVGLCCPKISPDTFRNAEAAPAGAVETTWLTLQSLSLRCSPPVSEQIRTESGATVRVQQYFTTVGSVTVSTTGTLYGVEAERDTVRCADISVTKIVVPGVHCRLSEEASLTSPALWEQWAAAELGNAESRYAEETTVQVGTLWVAANQRDLRTLGTLQGLFASSLRLYRPLQHFHTAPVCVLDTAHLTPRKLYAVLLSASVELRWATEGHETAITYKVLDGAKLSYSAHSIGALYSRRAAYLHGDEVTVSRIMPTTDTPVEILRAGLANNIENEAVLNWEEDGVRLSSSRGRRMCLFFSKSMPNECYAPIVEADGAAIGVIGVYVNVALPQLLMTLDYSQLDELCLLLRAHRLGARLAEQVVFQHLQRRAVVPAAVSPVLLNAPLLQAGSPTSIIALHLEYVKVNMYHELQPVLSLSSRKTDLHMLDFGPALNQTVLVMHSLRLFELTAKYAVHTCVIGDVDATMPNRVEMHITGRAGECSIMEAQFEHVRIFYLQRSTMVLLSYVRDHFIWDLYAGLGTASSVVDCDLVDVAWAPVLAPARGMLRLSAIFTKSEVHLPLNSCSTDALVIVIDTFLAYRTFPVAATTEHTTAYCKGPCLLRKQWLSEIRNSRRVIYQLFSDRPAALSAAPNIEAPVNAEAIGSGASALSLLFAPVQSNTESSSASVVAGTSASAINLTPKWVLPQLAAEILVPPAEVPFNTYPDFCLDLAINNANICSWCDSNAVADDITLTGRYALSPIQPGPDAEGRNRVWVDVVAEELDWVLSQGQYLSIINLIGQNFSEPQELVPDKYPAPTPKTVHLTEHLYGRYGLDSSIPIFSTVPLHIRKGTITAVESLPEYFELFCTKLPSPHYPYGVGGHDIAPSWKRSAQTEVPFKDTIPSYSKHVLHRNQVFARMAASTAAARGAAGGSASKGRTPRSRQSSVETLRGEAIIGVLFEELEVDFFRLHEGGGNGIEVAAGTFVIVGIDDRSADDDDANSVHSLNLDELSLDSIIFAPRSFPILNSGGNSSLFSTGKGGSSRKKRPTNREQEVEVSTPLTEATDSSSAKPVPHITYSQQGTQNLRRCVVTITDSMAVANIAKILHAVQYFLQPIHVNTHRDLYCLAQCHLGPYDFKMGLDMEVHVNNTVVCLTNISRREGASALCFHVNLDYVEAWRGFLSSGPGKCELNIDVSVSNIYIAPMREINSSRIQSLVDPCVLEVGQDLMTFPPERSLQRNLDLLAPWMTVGQWAHKVNKTDQPSTSRVVRFKVAPASATAPAVTTPRNPDLEQVGVSQRSGLGSDAQTEADTPVEAVDVEESSESESSQSEDGRSPRAGDTGDAYYSGTGQSTAPTVRVQISTKDIYFIAEAVKQARTALKKRLILTTTEEDSFAESKVTLQDIAHLPLLTYHLVGTALETPSKKNKNNELLAEICDFEAVLRNNTYNLNILRLNIFDNCMLYTRSPELLHMAAGSACAMWAYNEATDLWEPLVEPVNLRAIGATDESIQAAGMTAPGQEGAKRSGAKVRIEVVTDPVELNAPQTALGQLIRKLSLADVVTTSSIHLPPYKVINELGADVKFSIGMGDAIITEKDIETGKSMPVEVQQLAEALEVYKQRRNMTIGSIKDDPTSHKEYVMGITFANFRDIYCSRIPLPIDKVGVHTYDMFNTGQKLPDPTGTDVNFDRRRISLGGLGPQKGGLGASIAVAAATAAQLRNKVRAPDTSTAEEKASFQQAVAAGAKVPTQESVEQQRDTEDSGLERTVSCDVTYDSVAASQEVVTPGRDLSPRTPPPASVAADASTHGSAGQPPSAPASPARPALFRRASLSGASEPIKFMQEVPLAVMEMRIKADGVREILLRSILSFKNNTSRILQISVRLYGSSVETSLAPGVEWFVPVRFVNPKASLYIRLDERANWFEALSSMQGLIVQGYWGDPSRLRAHLCACPAESADARESGNGWILLIKPEVRDHKAQLQPSGARPYIPVRYPNKEAYVKALKEGINAVDPGAANLSAGGPVLKSRGANAQPMCIQLLAPLQLCNLIPQPLLYRLADADGLITSEGVLLPGELVDVHSIFKLFVSRIFISVRMLNYCWSKWTLVFSRTSPFANTEHNTDLTLSSLSLKHDGKELTLPSVDVTMVAREYLIRFCCSVLISNRTGLLLDLCESSTTENYLPFSSRTSAEAFLSLLSKHPHSHHQHRMKAPHQGPHGLNDTPSISERASFRRQRTASADGALGFRGHAAHFHAEQLPRELLQDIMAEEGEEEEGESDETSEGGSRSSQEDGSFELSGDESGPRGSYELDDEPTEGPALAVEQNEAADGGRPPRPERFSVPRQQSDMVVHSPLSPGEGEPTPGFDTPTTGLLSPVPPLPQLARTAAVTRSQGQIITLTVHLPFDHLRHVEVAASADWTLLDVFRKVKQRVASSAVHQATASYVFFPWENGKLGPRKVDNSLIIEAQEQLDEAGEKQLHGGKQAGRTLPDPPAAGAPAAKERPVSMFSRDKRAVDVEVPALMQYEMLAECSQTPLAMNTRVESLATKRLRLCHATEWEIYKQSKSIKTEVVEKEGLLSAIFSRPKCTHYATLVPFEGDIPFKPHRMMGFNPSLSLRVPTAGTEWSEAVDIVKGTFDASELCIVATANTTAHAAVASGSRLSMRGAAPVVAAVPPAPAPSPTYYEFGAYLERGRGFLQNVTTVTLVPKHVLVSKLSFAVQIRQITPSVECEPITLLPASLCSYHFPSKSKSKLLQLRKVVVPSVETAGTDAAQPSTTRTVVAAGDWLAELDICKIGILYAKLRDPVQIVKVQIDSVGASLVVTLTEQSMLWPPYRIDNMTAMELRYRQVVEVPKSVLPVVTRRQLSYRGGLDSIAEDTSADDVAPSAGSAAPSPRYFQQQLPWDHIERANSAPFAWDLPFSGRKAIQLEVRQLSSSWVPCEVCLDDDDKLPPLVVKKAAPSLGNPLAEGYLLRQDATGDGWTKVYCILRQDVLYIYPDETRDYLIEVINLAGKQVGDVAPQLASVTKYPDKRRAGTIGLITSVMGAAGAKKAVDINRTRTMMLQIAEFLGLLSNVTEHSFLQTRNRADSDSAEPSPAPVPVPLPEPVVVVVPDDGPLPVPTTPTVPMHVLDTLRVSFYLPTSPGKDSEALEPQPPALETAPGEDGEEVDWAALMEERETFSNLTPPDPTELVTGVLAEVTGLADVSSPILPAGQPPAPAASGEPGFIEDVEEETSPRESVASVRRARFSSAPGSSLSTLLAAKVSVEELLEEVSAVPVRVADIVEALLSTKLAEKADRARDLCEWMLTEGLLKPKAAMRAIDGSGPMDDMEDSDIADAAAAVAMRPDTVAEGTEAAAGDSDEDPDESADQFPASTDIAVKRTVLPAGHRGSISASPRMSFSRQTSRTSFSVGEESPADSGRKSIVSLGRRKPLLTKLYEDTDLYICPPPLNPEMQAMLEQINAEDEANAQVAGSAGAATSTSPPAEAEVFGFTISMDTVKYTFKCSSEMEFFGWIQACRQSIELIWVEYMLGRRVDRKPVSLEDYQATILLRLRADGSTKVLEIMQDDENITKEARNRSKSRMRGGRRNTVSSAEAIGKLSRVIRNSHLAPSLTVDSETKEFNREKELISVLFSVQSVALSVINSEPSELLYLSLSGIEMTVERSMDLVKFSGTVQEITLSNQLLNPEFAVALFPRRMKEGMSGRLMLPGLNQSRTTFPSLHLYIQQRYHQSISDVGNPAAADSFEEDSHLHYFEMFTLWISPLKLDLDEEIIVKCIRYGRGLKDVVYSPILGRGTELKEDLLSLQQLGSKSWEGHAERGAVFQLYMRLLDASKIPYQTYSPSAKSSTGIYLSLLQLHPIDVVMSFRNSPNLVVTNSELAMVSIISQLDSARLCLIALIAEHAFGSPKVLGGVLVKHYKAAFWRQFHKLIGAADIVEGSVGLVANLGSGVYDLFYEPIDGLLDENGSFLTGLSKGGISLASRTIGGTSAFTSQITGGLGKGVSLLTLDSQFQRNRAYRRFNKTSTVSEGLYVGTQELGKNIVEGVTGIVVSPYRGWETGGGVGLGMGIAKGILGVALKPAVGVFDLASRATEGLRNTAFSDNQDALERYGIHRKRIPRAFGRSGQIALYDAKAAAAQYVADSVTLFRPDPRLQVVHHLYIRRKLQRFLMPGVVYSPKEEEEKDPDNESWGFPLGRTYLVLVGHNRIVLAELSAPEKASTAKRFSKKRVHRPRKFIWSCPANCIEQLFSDPNGDLILSIGNSAQITGPWNSPCPVVLDNPAQNYVIFQSLLEQTLGYKRARKQPLNPIEGLTQADIRKRYSTGLKSFLMAPSNHTYRLCGHVLYEYSDSAAKRAAAKAEAGGAAGAGVEGADPTERAGAAVEAEQAAAAKSEFFIDQMVNRIFPAAESSASGAGSKSGQAADPVLDDMFLSFVYPLADLYIAGPTAEEGGRFHSITLSRLDGQKMRVLKSDEEQEHFSEYLKNSLSLIFARQEDASAWKHALEEQTLWNLDEDELVPPGPLTTEDRRKQGRTILTMARGAEEVVQPMDHSILGMLVLPTSACKPEQTETIKIEIAKTLSSTRWR